MDANMILQAITSVGFPIVACVGLFMYITKVMDKRDDKMDETLKNMTTVIAENNKVITVFSEKIDLLFKLLEDERKDGKDDGK